MPEGKITLLSWQIPEYISHQRGRLWYFLAIIFGVILIVYGMLTNNFLFALIVVLFTIIYGLLHSQGPATINFVLTDKGISLGEDEILYEKIQNFWLVNKENGKIKKLYLRLESFLTPLLSIPLEDQDPSEVRKILSQHVLENIEEKDETVLEILSRNLKL